MIGVVTNEAWLPIGWKMARKGWKSSPGLVELLAMIPVATVSVTRLNWSAVEWGRCLR